MDEDVTVTAGIWGFTTLFVLGIVCWLLFVSMNRHIRKVEWRAEAEEQAAGEQDPRAG
jgi:uncharacterized membrane protein